MGCAGGTGTSAPKVIYAKPSAKAKVAVAKGWVRGMLFIVKVVILVSMIKIALNTDRALMCAGIYTAIGLLFALLLGKGILFALIAGPIALLLAWLYFWLLTRTQESAVFWVIAIVGAVIGLV